MAGKYLVEIRLIERVHRAFPFNHIDSFIPYGSDACRFSTPVLKGFYQKIGVPQGMCDTKAAVMANFFRHLIYIYERKSAERFFILCGMDQLVSCIYRRKRKVFGQNLCNP